MSQPSRLAHIALLAAAAPLAIQSGPRLYAEWSTNPNCGHVLLTLPLALAILVRRIQSRPAEAGGKAAWAWGLGSLALASAAFALDAVLEEPTLLAAGWLAGGFGAVALLLGRGGVRAAAFAFVLLAFVVPVPEFVARTFLHLHLQLASAACSAGILGLAGYDTDALGAVVVVGRHALNVTEACSGLKAMTALVFLGLAAGAVFMPRQTVSRAVLAVFAVLVGFLANVLRLVAAGAIAQKYGMPEAERFLHGGSVLLVHAFGIALLLLLALAMRSPEEAVDP